MNIVEKNIPITMIRPDMDGIPVYPIPEDYSIRLYRAGDKVSWVELQSYADKFNKIDIELFHKSFGHDENSLSQRMFFLLSPDKEIIGTAAAWFDNDYHGEKYGRIHWVAIHPNYQGKGLSKPLLSMVCQKLIQLGHDKCYLTTSSARIPAINLYFKFGFKAEIISPEDETVWKDIKRILN